MNAILKTLIERKSERSFTDEPLTEVQLDAIIRAGHMAATSCNGQHVSVVVVRDAAKRAKIAEYAGNQPWVAKAPVFLAVICDLHKLDVALNAAGRALALQNCVEGLIMGSLDCGIALEAMSAAANSMNLGTVPIGGIRNNPQEMVDILGLPPLTFCPVGLAVGNVGKPSLARPRLPMRTFRHEETYDANAIGEDIAEYDKKLLTFWQENGRVDGQSWSQSVAPRFDHNERPKLRPMLDGQGLPFKD